MAMVRVRVRVKVMVRVRIRVSVRLPPSTLIAILQEHAGHVPAAGSGHAGRLLLGRFVWCAEELATHHPARARVRFLGVRV